VAVPGPLAEGLDHKAVMSLLSMKYSAEKGSVDRRDQPMARPPRSTETPSADGFCLCPSHSACGFSSSSPWQNRSPTHPLHTPQDSSPQSTLQNFAEEGEEKETQPSLSLHSKFLLRWLILSWGTALHIQARKVLSWKQLEARRALGTCSTSMPSSSSAVHLTSVHWIP